MKPLQNTLITALYKIRKSGIELSYPVSDSRIEEIITQMLGKYDLFCKVKPKVRATHFKKHGILENTSTIVDMMLVHPTLDGKHSSPTKVSLFFDSYINENEVPEYSMSARFNNRYKEAIYRPKQIGSEEDIVSYVNVILNELSHNKTIDEIQDPKYKGQA